MRKRTLEMSLWLPRPRDEVFAFFSNALNLDRLTPPWLHFQILTPPPIVMNVGTLVDYRIRLRWVPLRWRTAITLWEPPLRFVDEQVKGPYRFWLHDHIFEEKDGGTLVADHVTYVAPGWLLEPMLHRLFVGPDLRRIFAYRQERMREAFPEPGDR